MSIVIHSASHIPLVVTMVLDFLASAVSPPTALHWYLTDLLLDCGQLFGRTFDFLAFSCQTTGVRRTRALARFCIAISKASTAADGLNLIAGSCWTRFILHRIQSGPEPLWEDAEAALITALESCKMTPRNVMDFQAILVGLQTEGWDEAGDGLRVSIRSCLKLRRLWILTETVLFVSHPICPLFECRDSSPSTRGS